MMLCKDMLLLSAINQHQTVSKISVEVTDTVCHEKPSVGRFLSQINRRQDMTSLTAVTRYFLAPALKRNKINSYTRTYSFIHSFSILSDDRSKASSKTIPPYSAI